MADKKFTVNIHSPDKLLGAYEVSLLVCPAVDGEIGIMAGHMPMLCALRAGECRLTTDEETIRFAVTDGLLYVKNNTAEIFCEK